MSNQSVNVREAIKSRTGYYFMDFDYSQIEFRVSAALAGEKSLIEGFIKGNDYYKMVFAAMNGNIPLDQVTPVQRSLGKILALGQNYGQEEYGLAHKLKCDVDIARQYMDAYWGGLQSTKQAKEQMLQRALQTGGVRTWFGRWRSLPELFIKGATKREQQIKKKAIRSVWNSYIQGSAADWLKIAMVRVHRGLRGRDAHILLTVHDELLIEVSEKENLLEIRQIVKEAMEFKVKGLPIGFQHLYPDGFFVPIGEEYGYDWGNLYPLEDTEKKGKLIKGFRTYCRETNRPVNWDQPSPNLTYNFLATPNPQTNPIVIPAREKHVADEKKEVLMSSISGKHPIDHIVDVINQIKVGGIIAKPTPQTRQLEIPVTADAILLEAAQAAKKLDEQVIAPVVEEMVKEAKAEPLTVKPDYVPTNGVNEAAQPEALYENSPIDVAPPMHTAIVNGKALVAIPQSSNDFTYPCVIISATKDLTPENLKFLVALFGKCKGSYSVFITYRDKTIRAGDKYLVDPSNSIFVPYLKKGLGETTTCEIYDEAGRPARGRVNFV